MDELESDALADETGVVVEHYVAERIDAPPLSPERAAELTDRLFDATYAIGRTSLRGVRIGSIVVGPKPEALFLREGDWKTFATTRVVSLMDAWIRVWQDVVGVKPISARTREYLAVTYLRSGWSEIDGLATMMDLGVVVPSAAIANSRFASWAPFARWRADGAGRR
jgi:hypothetical protein